MIYFAYLLAIYNSFILDMQQCSTISNDLVPSPFPLLLPIFVSFFIFTRFGLKFTSFIETCLHVYWSVRLFIQFFSLPILTLCIRLFWLLFFLVILKNYRAILVGIENADNNDVDGDGDGSEHCNNNNYNEI